MLNAVRYIEDYVYFMKEDNYNQFIDNTNSIKIRNMPK